MTQRLAPAPVAVPNVPREFDADLLRHEVSSVDDLLEKPSDVTGRPQPRQGTYDEDGWYTPPPSHQDDVAAPVVSGTSRPALVGGAMLGAALVGLLGAAVVPASTARVAPTVPPVVVATVVADGFARLGVDDGAAAQDFRLALASDPGHPAALLGLGEAMLGSDPAGAAPALCAAARQPGAVGSYALGLLEQHAIRCD